MTAQEILNNLTPAEQEEVFSGYDSYFGKPSVVKKMKNYHLSFAKSLPNTKNPTPKSHRALVLSVYITRKANEQSVREKLARGKKVGDIQIEKFMSNEVDDFIINQATDNFEAEEGFEGFDDGELEEYETFLPVVAGVAAKAGKKILSKVSPKAMDKIKDLGNKIISKVAPKLAKKNEAAVVKNNAEIAKKTSDLVARGADYSMIAQKNKDLEKNIADISAKQTANLGNILIQDQQKRHISILDEIGKVLDQYKKNETEQAKAKELPKILLIVAILVALFVLLVKFAR